MKLFTTAERDVLKKFKKCRYVSEDDTEILNRYASVGFVHFGFNWDTMNKTAKLSNSGMKHLNKYIVVIKMAEHENNIKCPICNGDIIGSTVIPEFEWKCSYHCENGHWFMGD